MIIVIDGYSGSGKSSTAKAVAHCLGIQYLDSGALYRAVTYIWLNKKVTEEEFIDFLSSKDFQFTYANNQFHVYVDGDDISKEIRSTYVSDHVSVVATRPEIRRFVNGIMRNAVKDSWFIADGRDLGSAVFPDADLKIFMDASLDTRAKRRHAELRDAGDDVLLDQVKKNLLKRDQVDTTRSVDPLVQVEDAIVLNTTHKSFDDQVDEVCSLVREKLNIN